VSADEIVALIRSHLAKISDDLIESRKTGIPSRRSTRFNQELGARDALARLLAEIEERAGE
jgi:hypothetical protein